jgi:hypothetical protein
MVTKAPHGRSPEPPRTYDQARAVVRAGLAEALRAFETLPVAKRVPDEAVFCLRLHPDATAKTYDPSAMFDDAPQLRKIGSRNYHAATGSVAVTKRTEKLAGDRIDQIEGRLVFVRSSLAGYRQFLTQLDRPESQVPRGVQEELRRVERFDSLSAVERVVGFESGWKKGRVELVFHPTRLAPGQQMEFIFGLFDAVGVEDARRQLRPYPGGPTFVSCLMTAQVLKALQDVNPLRAAHPLNFDGLPDLRSSPVAKAPEPPASSTKSTIKVGMFDGGVDLTVPHLQDYVEQDETLSIATAADPAGVAHGTAVAGAILYGELNGFSDGSRLAPPPVSVVSIRAWPTSNRADIDLYESIDVIERAVPARKDIKVFNVSFGPRGPILDDTISRFTFALDTLSVAHKVLFVVAVGNDGAIAGQDRIQSPSDMVHGLGVGAYTLATGAPTIASYSCKGPGRECGKIKPDVVAFGGCPNTPIHLVSTQHGLRLLNWGTSFAAPLVTRVAGQAAEAFDRSSALLARALLVHGAVHPAGAPDNSFGHGYIRREIDDVLSCDENSVTVVFQSSIVPTRIVRLPIPLPDAAAASGKLFFRWTVAGLPPVDSNHPSDYTSGCLEDTFYPHARRFAFTEGANSRKRKVLDIGTEKSEVATLIAKRWKQSLFPATDSGNSYKDERTRRAIDCKWEPVVRRDLAKMGSSIWRPFLTLQAIGRNGFPDQFGYVVVVTVCAPHYPNDLYTDVRTQFPALVPIRVRTEAEIRVQIS